MRRAEVEKVLSRRDAADIVGDSELDAMFKKEGHVSLYILDHDWCAAIVFWERFHDAQQPRTTSPFSRSEGYCFPADLAARRRSQ